MTSRPDQDPDPWTTSVPAPRSAPGYPAPTSTAQPGYPGHPGHPGYQAPSGYYGSHPGPGWLVAAGRGLALTSLVLGGLYLLLVWVRALAAFPAAEVHRTAGLAGQDAVEVVTGYEVVSVLVGVALLAAWVSTCCWLVRARANSELMAPHHPTRARGWIWAGWIVPVVSLWFPFQVVRDIWRAGTSRGLVLLGWWWAAWLLGQALQNGAARLIPFSGPVDPDVVVLLGPLEVAGAVALTAAFALWCAIVLQVVRDQDRR